MTDSIVALYGGLPYQRKVVDSVVGELEALLEKAKSGEVVSVVAAFTYHDGSGGFSISGLVGSYSMLGALRVAENDVLAAMGGI